MKCTLHPRQAWSKIPSSLNVLEKVAIAGLRVLSIYSSWSMALVVSCQFCQLIFVEKPFAMLKDIMWEKTCFKMPVSNYIREGSL